jgi:hypothetical protein
MAQSQACSHRCVLFHALQRPDQFVNFLQNFCMPVIAGNPALRITSHEDRAAVAALDRLAQILDANAKTAPARGALLHVERCMS